MRNPPVTGGVVIAMNSLRLGGSQTYALELARRITSAGLPVVVVARPGSLTRDAARAYRVVSLLWREGAAELPRSLPRRLVFAFTEQFAAGRLGRLIRDPEAIIVSQPWPMHFMAVRMRIRWKGAKFYGLVHGTGTGEFPPPDASNVLPAFDHFFTATVESTGMLRRMDLPVTLLGNLFDGQAHWGRRPEVRSCTGSDRAVLSLGTLTANKSKPVRALIEAARDQPGWRVDIVGDGPDRAELERMAQRIGLSGRVVFHGGLRDPRPRIAAADVVMAAGRAALEAATGGRPVVVASSEGIHGPLTVSNAEAASAANFTGRSRIAVPVSAGALRLAVEDACAMPVQSLAAIQALLWRWGSADALIECLRRGTDGTVTG